MKPKPLKLSYYKSAAGKTPFTDWFKGLRDPKARAKISIRLDRVIEGNLGDCAGVGAGILELRIDYGPGYRVYCIQEGERLVVLLCGGIKKGQQKDIESAKEYAKDYRSP